MKIVWVIIIFIIELIWSYAADRSHLYMLRKKEWYAAGTDLIAQSCAWIVLFLVAKWGDWNTYYIGSSILGIVLGRFLVAKRKPKRKRVYVKKSPVTTA